MEGMCECVHMCTSRDIDTLSALRPVRSFSFFFSSFFFFFISCIYSCTLSTIHPSHTHTHTHTLKNENKEKFDL